MNELCTLSAVEQARRVRSRQLSARDLTEAHLAHIESVDGTLGALITQTPAQALAQADAVDTAIANGETVGPLAGVPVVLKDALVTEGIRTTAGSKILGDWEPPYTATCVSKLEAAGAIVLGKANMDEFAMGSSNEHSAFATCRNPWDLEAVPGGSSGGSAVAVSARMSAIALGTDTGGSVRQPASFCGVVGVKPTYGRVSRYGVIAYASSLDQVGPFARSVEDAALVLQAISGHDPLDATSIREDVPDFQASVGKDIKGLRIGIPAEYFAEGIDADVLERVETALAGLESEGAVRVPVKLPHTQYAIPAYYLIAPAEASSNLARFDGVRYGTRADGDLNLKQMYCETRGRGFGRETKRRIMLGTFALRAGYYDQYYGQAQRARTLIQKDFTEAFKDVDVIASPTAPTTAFKIGQKSDPLEMYLSDVFTLSCNLAGIPGLSVPVGFTEKKLPVGLQLLGRPFDEETLLKTAFVCERQANIKNQLPPGSHA